MGRELEKHEIVERSIIKTYRKRIWNPFLIALKNYKLVNAGDKIAVCISGGKDSMLMAKLLQELGFKTAAMALCKDSVDIDNPQLLAEEKLKNNIKKITEKYLEKQLNKNKLEGTSFMVI